MLAALTANMNRSKESEIINHSSFLKYPASDRKPIPGLTAEAAAISLSIVPSPEMSSILIHMRDRLATTYIWNGNSWLYSD